MLTKMKINFSLNPKSYFATDKNGKVKSAAKGVQGKNKFRYENYKAALYDQENIQVENRMFRLRDGVMSTVYVKKTGLSNVFTKATILEDRITVRPHKRHINI